MKTNPKVSILTACHNDEKFINECGKSILSQTYRNIEWIVVDDCSTDSSFDILSKFKDDRVTLLRNDKRVGCSSTYARALSAATGDICGVVDGDDAIIEKACHAILRLYQQFSHLGYIYTQHWWCDNNLVKKRKGISSLPESNLSFTKSSLKKNQHSFSHWRTFRTDLRDKTILFPEGLQVSVDKNLGFTLERVAYGGFYPKCLYMYRYYPGNMSFVQAPKQKKTWIDLAKRYEKEGSATFGIMKVR